MLARLAPSACAYEGDFPTSHAGDLECIRTMRRSRLPLAVGLLTLALLGFAAAGPALASQINAVYDSGVSSRSDYQQIKSAFGQAADAWSNVLTDNVTVNIRVSFGGVGGTSSGPPRWGQPRRALRLLQLLADEELALERCVLERRQDGGQEPAGGLHRGRQHVRAGERAGQGARAHLRQEQRL